MQAVWKLLNSVRSDWEFACLGQTRLTINTDDITTLDIILQRLELTLESGSIPEQLNFLRITLKIDEHKILTLLTNVHHSTTDGYLILLFLKELTLYCKNRCEFFA